MKNAYLRPTAGWKVPVIPIDDAMNPFKDSGVRLFVLAGQTTSYITIKAGMTYWMLEAAKRAGKLEGVKHIVVASSGATALSLAMLARDEHFGIPNVEVVAVIKKTVPDGKRLPVKFAGVRVMEPIGELSGIETARELGRQEGWHCLDQYGDMSNPNAYRDHLAPHIISQMEPLGGLNLLVAGVGTGGTIVGLSEGLKRRWDKLHVVGAMCIAGQTIPGMRSEDQMSEIVIPWREAAGRFIKVESLHAYIAALQMQETGMMMGISAGATYVAALMILKQRLAEGTLDELRGSDGSINALFVAHDGLRTYTANKLPEEVERYLEKDNQPKVWELLGIKA